MDNKCDNCKKILECGCQRRTASNGVSCCGSCIKQYEEKISKKN
jgi:hypothetical protein